MRGLEGEPNGDRLAHDFPPTDLRRFRSYKGTSVRDLLRAMRNKVRPGSGGPGSWKGLVSTSAKPGPCSNSAEAPLQGAPG